MTWTDISTIKINRGWQYTEPIAEGTYFRFKHAGAPIGGLFAVALCELGDDGQLSIGNSQVLAVDKNISDVIQFPIGAYMERRIAIKRFNPTPSLEEQIRGLFLPNFLLPPPEIINYIKRNDWQISIEVSDYVEVSNSTPASSGVKLNYVSSGDENGLIYYLGTNKKTTNFTNPVTSGLISVFASSVFNSAGSPERITDRDPNTTFTSNDAGNSFVGVDLKNNSLVISAYTIRGNTGGRDNYLRSWRLEASNDNQNWEVLDLQTNNTTINESTFYYKAIANQSTAYRYFRIIQTGGNSASFNYLYVSELEFYGRLPG